MKLPKHRVGRTRSGKFIYTFTTDHWAVVKQQIVHYSFDDHFDAWLVFERLTVREFRRLGAISEGYSQFLQYATLHKEFISDEFIFAEKLRLGLTTSPDLVRFAAKLTEEIFLD